MLNLHSIGPIEKPQVLEGRLTYVGIGITLLGALARRFGFTFPESEATDFAGWLAVNWDTLAQGAGLLIAFYGRLRINWRKS